MKAHLEYSQNLAVEFSDLIKDYEELVEAPEDIVIKAQEEVEIEAVCEEFEELMKREPIAVLRALRPYGLVENAEEEVFGQGEAEVSHENAEELVGYRTIRSRTRVYRRHKKVHSTNKNFKCSICNKRFGTKSYLNDHARVHTGEKPYECTICSKKFRQKCYLKLHSRIHTGEKPYECTICDKRFSQKCTLNSHSRIHTGEKPYECTICDKRFRQKCTLNLHSRIHTGEKPYSNYVFT